MDTSKVPDPIKFGKLGWPDIHFYKEQRDIIYSVAENEETFVPAGNALGKDFVSAFIALWFFCSRSPARVVTTSVKFDQLNDVLWGEIRRFLDTCKVNLPIHYTHMKIRQVRPTGEFVPLAELVGQVINKGESLLGRHLPRDIPRTLAIFDEASGIDDMVYDSSDTWAHRKLIIGNPYPCTNFFFHGVKGGNLQAIGNNHLYRKVIKIKAEHSPNVRLAEAQKKTGQKVTGEVLIPGVKEYQTYLQHRAVWDKVRQCIGLDAEFYEGAEVLLFPPDWLDRAERTAKTLIGKGRRAKAIGIDPAEGGDKTAMAATDELGLIELVSKKTPDTSVITGEALAFAKKHRVDDENILFDAGGGGKEHADRLRAQGHKVRAIPFGGAASAPKRRGLNPLEKRVQEDETRLIYKNRRAEMYGMLHELLEPIKGEEGWGIPEEYTELRRQLAPIKRDYDGEGQLVLPPKHKKDPLSTKKTMQELIGCSPDEADAVVLAVFGMKHKRTQFKIRSMV